MSSKFESQVWTAHPKNASQEGIHNDETAQRMGFESAFVPGVTLYESLVVGLLKQDPDWLSHGRVEMNFRRPVYNGEEVALTVDGPTQEWELKREGDERARAYGLLAFSEEPPTIPTGADGAKTNKPLGDPSQIGTLMETSVEFAPERIELAAEASGFPRTGSPRTVPVGLWTNPVDLLHAYFDCTTTIHFTSRVWHYSPLRQGEILHKRGELVGFEDRRGNKVVKFNAELSTSGRLIAVIAHASVYQLAGEA